MKYSRSGFLARRHKANELNYKRLFIPDSYVFLTVVTNNRRKILIKNIEILRAAFKNAKKYFNFEAIAIVILPDHFHLLVKPENIKDYPKIITSIKYYFSKNITVVGLESPTYDRNKGIWQRRYNEHTIRDENDLHRHLDYIHYNPVKHALVQKVKDWEFSSFNKFVKTNNYEADWGVGKDIEKIKELNYE